MTVVAIEQSALPQDPGQAQVYARLAALEAAVMVLLGDNPDSETAGALRAAIAAAKAQP